MLERSVNLIPWQARHWIKHVPLIARLQRFFFKKFLSGRSFLYTINAGPAKGLKYPISLPLDKAIWTGAYEAELATAVASKVSQGDVCYDIGAYRGFFSGVFALAGASTVIAFEPFSENCAQLARLASSNPDLPLTIERIAIAKEDCTLAFNVMPDSSMGKLASSTFQPTNTKSHVTQVRVRSLDSFVADGNVPPQIIKIDVEGAEAQVLEGAKITLQTYRPLLIIEAHSQNLAAECTNLLRDLEYEVEVFEKDRDQTEKVSRNICHLIGTPKQPRDADQVRPDC